MKRLIKNGLVITSGDSILTDILIDGETIVELGKHLDEHKVDEVIDAAGCYVMPGGIDPHTHLEMPFGGTVSSDDFFTGQRAAAFGGTTFHIDFALQSLGDTMVNAIDTWKERAKDKAVIDYSFHVAMTDAVQRSLDEIPALKDAGVTSLKVFMAYKNLFQVDDTTFLKVLRKCAEHGITTMVHAENGDAIALITEQLLAEGKTGMKYHSAAHSAAIEAEAASRAVYFVEMTGAPLYIVHIACEEALDAVRRGRRKGLPVMGETCTQYMFTTEDDIDTEGFEGAKFICSPPPKGKQDQAAVWEALRDGTLQTIATDHCPFWYEGGIKGRIAGKELGQGDWSKVPNGVPGIEDRFCVMWQNGVNTGRISPNRFVQLVATNPAKIFGLYPKKGTITVGSDADLVIFDPHKEKVISAAAHHMNVDYNLYEGMTIKGWPKEVMVRGKTLVKDDQWLGEQGFGQFTPRKDHGEII